MSIQTAIGVQPGRRAASRTARPLRVAGGAWHRRSGDNGPGGQVSGGDQSIAIRHSLRSTAA